MKILLVITGLGVGGAERLVANMADQYVAHGHEVVIAFFHGLVEIQPLDKRVRLVNLGLEKTLLGVFKGLLNLRRLIQDYQPDVVNSHMLHPNILCRLLRVATPMKRLVSSAHNTNEGDSVVMLAYRLTNGLADAFTNVSHEAVKTFEKKKAAPSGHIVAIPNGIDTTTFIYDDQARKKVRNELCLDDGTPVFLAVGRLWEQKDYPNLLSAISHLSKQGHKPYVLVAGDGPLRSKLEEQARSLSVVEQFRFLGVRNDVLDLMSACDFYVMSSAWEGLPMVILEAMSCHCPIISTDCGGVREAIGGSGILVPTSDSLALANALKRALSWSKEERAEIGKIARERVVENYSLNKTVSHYLDLYQSKQPL